MPSNTLRIRSFLEKDHASVVALWSEVFADDPPRNEPHAVIGYYDPDERLTLCRDRIRGFLVTQHLGSARCGHTDRLHASLPGAPG